MKKTIYLVRYQTDLHNDFFEEKIYAFTSKEKAEKKVTTLNEEVEKWNDDNGYEIVYAEGVGKLYSLYENDYRDRFEINIEEATLDCED